MNPFEATLWMWFWGVFVFWLFILGFAVYIGRKYQDNKTRIVD